MLSCNSKHQNNTELSVPQNAIVYHTTEYTTALSSKKLDLRKIEQTQYHIKKSSIKQEYKEYDIKIFNDNVKLYSAGKKERVLTITKKWLDPIGPDSVYNLIDTNKIEYLFSHYIDSEKKHYFALRYLNQIESFK